MFDVFKAAHLPVVIHPCRTLHGKTYRANLYTYPQRSYVTSSPSTRSCTCHAHTAAASEVSAIIVMAIEPRLLSAHSHCTRSGFYQPHTEVRSHGIETRSRRVVCVLRQFTTVIFDSIDDGIQYNLLSVRKKTIKRHLRHWSLSAAALRPVSSLPCNSILLNVTRRMCVMASQLIRKKVAEKMCHHADKIR